MDVRTEKRFFKSSLGLALLLCTLPQVLRSCLNLIYEYYLKNNVSADASLAPFLTAAADFLGTASLFAGFAIAIYLVFLHGIRGGGEWIVALIAGYAFAYILLAVVEDAAVGLAAFALSTAATLIVLFRWLKGGRGVTAAVALSLFLAVVGGMILLLATTVPSVPSILAYGLYGILNFGYELLLLAASLRFAGIFRRRAIEKGGKSADIALGRRLFPHGHPVLRTFLLADGIYTAVLVIGSLIDSVSLVQEYGLPVNGQEWFSLFRPYLEYAVLFALAYAVMVITALLLERAYFKAID